MTNFVNVFLSYLLVLVIIAVVGGIAIALGITLRRKKNREAGMEEAAAAKAEDAEQ